MHRQSSVVLFFILILISVITTNVKAENPSIKKRIYITNFERKGDISEDTATRIRNNIKISILEKFGREFRIISDDDVKIMFTKAGSLQANGNNDENHNLDVARAMNADYIVYGTISRESGKIVITAYNLETGGTSAKKGTGVKSSITVSFNDNDIDWMSVEIAVKLINEKYKISKIPPRDEIAELAGIEITPLKKADLVPIVFKRDEPNLNAIMDHYRVMADEGDALYRNDEYIKARLKYIEVIKSIYEKMTAESREKIRPFIDSINMRIALCLVMEFKPQIEKIDISILPESEPDEKDYKKAYDKYVKIEEEIRLQIQKEISSTGQQSVISAEADSILLMVRKITDDRKDYTIIKNISIRMKNGNDYYREFEFNNALGKYNSALLKSRDLKNQVLKGKIEKTLNLKVDVTISTGKSYFEDTVNSLIDQAEFYNVVNNVSDARKSMKKARDLITGPLGKFATDELIIRYNNCAALIPDSSRIDETAMAEVHKNMNDPLNEKSFKENIKDCFSNLFKAACVLGLVLGAIASVLAAP